MFSIAICDDQDAICRQLETYLKPYTDSGAASVDVFYTGEKLYESMFGGMHYDLIFLDIRLKKMNGIETAKRIRNELKNEKTQIVYISSTQQYAMDLFAVRPMNFLLKPLSKNSVFASVDKAMELAGMFGRYFEFKAERMNYRLPFDEILYFESCNRVINVYTRKTVRTFYGKLNEIEKDAPANFIRIHQSYLINRSYVTYWKYDEVMLDDDVVLPISRVYQKKAGDMLRNDD